MAPQSAVRVLMLSACKKYLLAGVVLALLGALIPAATPSEGPRDQPPQDLTEATLEQLMNLEITSVAKKEQELSKAPAAICVITREDIRRSGLTSIPELLRLAPGVEVARISAHQWAISARGFNGRYADKMLVLIDGRSVYTPMFSGVYWDAQDLPVEDIERIEVIRGPGAAMWGANAVNGVINIISRPAKDTHGGLIAAGGGNRDPGSGSVRYGGPLGPQAYFRVYSTNSWYGPSLLPGGRSAHDDWNMNQGGFRVDWDPSGRDSWTFQGDGYRSRLDQTVWLPTLAVPFSQTVSQPVEPEGEDLLARWKHRISDRSDTELQFYYDAYSRPGEALLDRRHTFDLDFQQRFAWSARQELLWGLGVRASNDNTVGSFYISVDPAARTDRLFSAFLQDEFRIVPDRLFVTLGSKFEHNDYTGFEVQPDLRLMWTPTRRQAVWGAVSRAVRTPSRMDEGALVHPAVFPGPGGLLSVTALLGAPGFRSESLTAYQTGYRLEYRNNLSLDLTGFWNFYDHLLTLEPGTPHVVSSPVPYLLLPAYFENRMYGRGRGVEASGMFRPAHAWRLSLSYSWLDLDLRLRPSSHDIAGQTANTSPAHQAQAHSYLDLPFHLQWDAGMYYVGAIPVQAMPAYLRLDTRLGWRPLPKIEFSTSLQNLLDNRHSEFFSPADLATQRFEIGRSIFGELVWRF